MGKDVNRAAALRAAAGAFMAVLAGGIGVAAGAPQIVDGVSMELPIPPGFCAMSRDQEVDRLLYEQQDRMQSAQNLVLAMFARCEEFDALRRGLPISQHGMWLLSAPQGKPLHMPANQSRASFLDEVAAAVPKLDTAKIGESMGENARREQLALNLQRIGVIDRNADAVYLGMLATVAADGADPRQTAAVIGITTIRQRGLTLGLYGEYRGQGTHESLLAQAKPVMAQLIAANVLPATNDAELPAGMRASDAAASSNDLIDWRQVLIKAAIGAAIAGALAGAAALWRRLRRREA